MPVPVIDTQVGYLVRTQNDFWEHSFIATNAPTSWAATGYPDGMSFDTPTGFLHGSSEGIGFYDTMVTATNASGTSLPIFFPILLLEAGSKLDATVELDIDLITGTASTAVAEGNDAEKPVLQAKLGDILPLSIGWHKGGDAGERYYHPMNTMVAVQYAFKVSDQDPALITTSGLFRHSGYRCQIHIPFTRSDALLRAFSGAPCGSTSNASRRGRYLDGISEIQWSYAVPDLEDSEALIEINRTSLHFATRLHWDMIAP